MTQIIIFIISFLASLLGAMSGIGGGTIIKPLMELLQTLPPDSLHFASGITVLAMTSVALLIRKEQQIQFKISLYLAVGSAVGGIFGHFLFTNASLFIHKNWMGVLQNSLLLLINFLVLLYLKNKSHITTHCYENRMITLLIGFSLGTLSSFLGIGGGPLNFIVLYYFYSFNAKEAAINSLFLIFFAQLMSLSTSVISNNIPTISMQVITFMIAGGVGGALLGKKISSKLENHHIETLFSIIIGFIIIINIMNIYSYVT